MINVATFIFPLFFPPILTFFSYIVLIKKYFFFFFRIMDVLATVISPQTGEESGSLCPSLPLKQRLIGFGACFCLGLIFGFFSWVSIVFMNYETFALMFTLANVSTICGSFFLAGPVRQAKMMFTENRWIATLIYILSLIATILVVIFIPNVFLVVLCSMVQFTAMWWYFLSYIPGAHSFLQGVFAAKFG